MINIGTMLPPNWPIVMSQVESVKELGECRLVSKAWDSPAEAEMFRRQLHLTNKDTIGKLLYHLKRKPYLSQYINSLLFGVIDKQYLALQQEILCTALTPSIRKLEGIMCNELFDVLLTIGRSRVQRFEKLESLPVAIEMNDKYVETVLFFKESLQELTISEVFVLIGPIIGHLDEFSSLTKLNLDFHDVSPNLIFLDIVLGKCNLLKQLELEWASDVNYPIAITTEMEHWLLGNVRQVASLVKLNLGKIFNAQVVEYLVYKYPNVSTIFIGPFETQIGCSFGPILDAIKNIDSVYLSLWSFNNCGELYCLISNTRSKKNRVRIQQCCDANVDCWAMMNATEYGYNKSTLFDIELTKDESPAIFEDILLTIGSVHCLEINYYGYNSEGMSFYDLLAVIPEVENLKFADRCIIYRHLLLDGLGLNKLTSLELRGVAIDGRFMPALSKNAENLKHLTLDTCIFDWNHQNHAVSMPQSNLETLSIITTDLNWHPHPDDDLQWKKQHTSIVEDKVVFLLVSRLLIQQSQYHALKSGQPSCKKRISVEEFGSTIGQYPRISIQCRSLSILNIDLGELVIKMNFNVEAPIEEMGDWRRLCITSPTH